MMIAVALLALAAVEMPPLDVGAALKLYNAHVNASEKLPHLTQKELQRVRAGVVVRKYLPPAHEGAAAGVVGVMIADVPREALWVAIRDGHLAVTEGLTERRISGTYANEHETWFGLLVLPTPFQPRHWRIEVGNEIDVTRATKGRVWERRWHRIKEGARMNREDAAGGKLGGITVEALDGAVYTAENHGAWTVIALDARRCLLIYRAAADIAGVVPHEIVSALARMRLEELLRGTVSQAVAAPTHYVAGHEPIFGGDGAALPYYDR